MDQWKRIIRDLTQRGMTDPEDRLPAVAGIAQVLQSFWGDDETYVVGMWKSQLIFYLTWRVLESNRPRSATYRAPTWSWAALDNSIKFIPFDTAKAEVVETQIIPRSSNNPFGSAQSGHLVLRGRIVDNRELCVDIDVRLIFDTPADSACLDNSCYSLFLIGTEDTARAVGLILTACEDGEGYRRAGLFQIVDQDRKLAKRSWEVPNAKLRNVMIY